MNRLEKMSVKIGEFHFHDDGTRQIPEIINLKY